MNLSGLGGTCAATALSDVGLGIVIIVAEADLVLKPSTSVRTGTAFAYISMSGIMTDCHFCFKV